MLTLKAAGLVDIDAGEIVRPGILRIEDDRIAGVGGDAGPAAGEVIDLGELTLLPGLMDMEVNLLTGGRGQTAAYSPIQDDPPLRVLRAVGNARRTLRAGLHDRPQSGTVREDRWVPARRRAGQGDRRGVDRRAAGGACRARDHADRRAPGPHDVRGRSRRACCR